MYIKNKEIDVEEYYLVLKCVVMMFVVGYNVSTSYHIVNRFNMNVESFV